MTNAPPRLSLANLRRLPPQNGGEAHIHLFDSVQLSQRGSGVEEEHRQARGRGILDAHSDLAKHGPEAERGGAPREKRGDQGGGGSGQALHERDRADAGVARVTLVDAVESPRRGVERIRQRLARPRLAIPQRSSSSSAAVRRTVPAQPTRRSRRDRPVARVRDAATRSISRVRKIKKLKRCKFRAATKQIMFWQNYVVTNHADDKKGPAKNAMCMFCDKCSTSRAKAHI